MSINRGNFDHSKLSNPRTVGPGCWKTLHMLAVYDDLHGQNIYPGFIRYFCEHFKCGDCSKHCLAFLNKNPPEKYKNIEHGMAEHSWEFHNVVNKANGKPQLEWEMFVKIFIEEDEEGVCQKGCGEKKLQTENLSEVNFARIKNLAGNDNSLIHIRKEMPNPNLKISKRKR